MKKWNNPELMILGVENTSDDTHYCHKEGVAGCTPNSKGDHRDPTGKDHFWSGNECNIDHKGLGESTSNGNSKCCCFGLS